MSTLWRIAYDGDSVVAEHAIRLTLPSGVTWDDLFATPDANGCLDLGLQVAVRSTSFVYQHRANGTSFGLATAYSTSDECGQEAHNLVAPLSKGLYRADGSAPTNTIRHLLSYVHTSAGEDASRCNFACWTDANGLATTLYDGFTWAVREIP